MNFYKRYMGDYGRDTAHLSLAEHGAYTLLLDHYYSTEQPLPAEFGPLYRICRAFEPDEQAAVRDVADAFFPIGPDGLRRNDRADEQIEKDRKAIDTAKANGRKGGRPRKKTQPVSKTETQTETQKEPKKNPAGFDSETQWGTQWGTQRETSPDTREEQEQEQEQEQKQDQELSLVQQAARPRSRFAEFWDVYPVKKGKQVAERAWTRKGLDRIADKIIADVKARKSGDRQWIDGYIPHGSTYVNQEVWQDAIEPPRLRVAGGTDYVPMPGEV